jgi:hypothetical protein
MTAATEAIKALILTVDMLGGFGWQISVVFYTLSSFLKISHIKFLLEMVPRSRQTVFLTR